MKKYVLIMAAIMFGIFAMPTDSAASPRFEKKSKYNKHRFERDGRPQHNAMAYHQHEKIQAMTSIAKADGRISRNERAIIKYEQRQVADNRHPQRKRGKGKCHSRS
jgi:hypothetical protein